MDSKEEKVDGCVIAIAIPFVLLIVAATFLESYAGKGHAGGFRGTVSADWHHLKCDLKLCDEDGKCPVWSSKDSRCYMLTRDEEKFMEIYEKTK